MILVQYSEQTTLSREHVAMEIFTLCLQGGEVGITLNMNWATPDLSCFYKWLLDYEVFRNWAFSRCPDTVYNVYRPGQSCYNKAPVYQREDFNMYIWSSKERVNGLHTWKQSRHRNIAHLSTYIPLPTPNLKGLTFASTHLLKNGNWPQV